MCGKNMPIPRGRKYDNNNNSNNNDNNNNNNNPNKVERVEMGSSEKLILGQASFQTVCDDG